MPASNFAAIIERLGESADCVLGLVEMSDNRSWHDACRHGVAAAWNMYDDQALNNWFAATEYLVRKYGAHHHPSQPAGLDRSTRMARITRRK